MFSRVARKGSFSAAGKELNVPQSTVSRVVAALEKEIGAVLLTRTTRAVSLTDAGSDFLPKVEQILSLLDAAQHEARGTGELRGSLRVALSSSLAIRVISPIVADFLDQHPALRIELVVDDQRRDLVSDTIDVALRLGPLNNAATISKLVASWPIVVAAAPRYLEKHGTPRTPSDLASHAVVTGWNGPGAVWTFTKDGKTTSMKLEGRLTITLNEAITAAAVEGAGIVSMGIEGDVTLFDQRP